MLGKLLKQEFRATGRIMLPVFGALLILSVLANFSIRLLDAGVVQGTVLKFLAVFVIGIFIFGMIAAGFMTLFLMISPRKCSIRGRAPSFRYIRTVRFAAA